MPRRYCLNFFGMILTRDKSWIDQYVINHEDIHTVQQREMLFVPFYIFYVWEFLIKLLYYRNWDRAYRAISFEREAYFHDHNLCYLRHRRHYAWLKHIIERNS